MELLKFLKDKWVVLMDVAAIIVVFITDVIKPPYISESLSAYNLNILAISKFIVIGVLIVLAVPLELYKAKVYSKIYWIMAIIFFVFSLGLIFNYIIQSRGKTVYDETKNEHFVIGNRYKPGVLAAIKEERKNDRDIEVTPQIIILGNNDPDDVWYKEERESNALILIISYLAVILSGALFLILGMQAIKITTSPDQP